MITATDVVLSLAESFPGDCLTFVRYRPQSGAARRAQEAGHSMVPILMDVSPDPHHLKVPAGGVGAYLRDLQLAPGEVVALCSPLAYVGHLLLLDFSRPYAAGVEDELSDYLRYAGWRGWLLCSGASYHFIGAVPLSLAAWVTAMGQALLIPDIDTRYMGHSIHRRQGAVRLTACPLKPTVPFVVAVLS